MKKLTDINSKIIISKGYAVSKEQDLILLFLMHLYGTRFIIKVMNFRILEYWNFLQYIYMPKKNIFFLKWWKKIENNCLKRSDLFKNLFIFKTMVMCFIGSVKIRTVDWFSQRLSSRWNWNKKCKQSDFTT